MKLSEAALVQKLKHLAHLEDLIVLEGREGATAISQVIDDLTSLLKGGTPAKFVNTKVKIDGAPSLTCGINPENKAFFVSTKGLFAKDPKINYTEEDIDVNHGHAPGLAEKLKVALKYLPSVIFSGVYQGDFLYTKEDLRIRRDNDINYIVFKPNTLIYAVPQGSDLGQRILDSEMGIAFHTKYKGDTIESLSASFSFEPFLRSSRGEQSLL